MAPTVQTIALVAVGNLGKYVCEALVVDPRYDVVVITRKKQDWFLQRNIHTEESDYSESSIRAILDARGASTLVSFLQAADKLYLDLHQAWLTACLQSKSCKRFIPSEWAGNVDDYPQLPKFYAESRLPFRRILQETVGIEWTLFNCGWLVDYFLPQHLTRMPAEPDTVPIDANGWRACIRGSGDELQSWTWTKDVAAAVGELLAAPSWESTTYVTGQWGTFNDVVRLLEAHYGRELEKTYKTVEEIMGADDDNLDLWMISGGAACPREKTLSQRDRYFSRINFATLGDLLKRLD
ncbi:hypothetical protein F5B22DRAFT_603356 [Xylaria bambusicola]|uniref:uncharacterized protein n=1 Tax=Xylaria bambusicola TaxID=326684 RepID=UPI0020079850|nr:uncharacterized protein F5B22DRAFT_603356 [Xylaria bambusicola]KAI0517551.1 hypothetical protein F5B22DRAFT_603356 [Xylaria bambusicola]